MSLFIRNALGVAFLGIMLAACGKTEPPPPPPQPPKAEAPAPTADQALQRLVGEVYIYAYPMMLMDVTRQVDTAKVPLNTFQHDRIRPDPGSKHAAAANADVLYSRAWLDLSKEPVVLSFPDTHGRYYVMPMLDAWTDVFSSPGKRQSGTEARDFVVVGPFNKQAIPHNLTAINAPTDMVWVVGRIDPGAPGEYASAVKLQDHFKAVPLSQWSARSVKHSRTSGPPGVVDTKTQPVEQIARMDAKTYFTRFALLLAGNPPSKNDGPMSEKMAKLGIVAGRPFDMAAMDAAAAKAMEEGVIMARDSLATSARSYSGELTRGWTIDWQTGRYGTYYGLRAVMALLHLGANAPEDAIFASSRVDADGKPLSGESKYVLHFDKGAQPPTDAFWAVSLYDDGKHFVPNPMNRFTLGDNDKLRTNDDGSLDLYIQHASPGTDKESNWLPSPVGSFNVLLRIYWPKQEILDHKWTPPAIRVLR